MPKLLDAKTKNDAQARQAGVPEAIDANVAPVLEA